MRTIVALAALALTLGASAQAQEISKYRVYCIGEGPTVDVGP